MKAITIQLLFLILLFEFAIATFCDQASASDSGDTVNSKQPNIVLVYADDVDCETVFGQFPKQDPDGIRFENLKALAKDGVRFSNFHVTTPVCGPSRACLYTGQYAHRNGCRVNDSKSMRASGFIGGYTTFNPNHELAIWMKKSGYNTAHVGKYLHADFQPDYRKGVYWKHIVPPGWDHFRLSLGSNYLNFPSYIKSTDRFTKTMGDEYRTDWDIRNAIAILQKHANGDNREKPLMLCWSPIAAHITGNGQPMVAPRHKAMFGNAEIPELKKRLNQEAKHQIDEMQVFDIPAENKLDYLTDVFRDRLRAMKSIDEGIGELRSELEKLGMLDNTIFIVTSDHGFRFAQHRHFGKRLPYDRITRVPFLVSGPGIPKNVECDQLLANIDIAPTLVDLSGQRPPVTCDGKSFADLMLNPEGDKVFERDAILIENWGEAVSHNHVIAATYNSMRLHDSVYTEWATGGREYYDLASDPEQNHNLFVELDENRKKELAEKLRGLRNTDAKPNFTNTHFDRDKDCRRICASLMPVTLSGTVESDAGTEQVELEIRCTKTGEFWTDRGWSRARTGFLTDLKQPGGLTSDWEFELDTNMYSMLRHANLAARNVEISLVAKDLKQRTTRKNAMSFSLSFADPETTIDSCEVSQQPNRTLTVSGNAVDLIEVASVRVAFQDPVTKQYWDGKTWTNKYYHFEAKTSSDSESPSEITWSLDVPTPDVTALIVIARAYNLNTLFDHTPSLKNIVLETAN